MSQNAQKRQMQHVARILEKKFSHPRFREALTFGSLKKSAEKFFCDRGLKVNIVEFDSKEGILTINVSHPSVARELLGYQEELNAILKRSCSPRVKSLRIKSRSPQ